MNAEPALLGALELLDDDTLPRDRMRDVIGAAAAAAHGLFAAGDLDRALAAWGLVIAATQRHGFEAEPYERLTSYVWERARTLDHLDDLDGALAGYEEWRKRLEASGRMNLLRWADASIARIRRKVARRDAGLSYRLHTRGVRPEARAWEGQQFRERAARLPARWEQRDRQRAQKEAKAADEAAERAALEAWRSSASPAAVEEYDDIHRRMRDLAAIAFDVSAPWSEKGELTVELGVNREVWAEGEALGRRARELRAAPLQKSQEAP